MLRAPVIEFHFQGYLFPWVLKVFMYDFYYLLHTVPSEGIETARVISLFLLYTKDICIHVLNASL